VKTTSLLRLIILTLLLLALGVLGAAGQAGRTFFVTDVDASVFPGVQFHMRAVDLDNKVITGLNPTNLAVYENGQQVSDLQVTPNADGPVTYIFVIDQGRLANFTSFQLSNIRQVISSLVSGGYFVDGRDTVLVLGRQFINSDQTVTLLPATQTATDLTTWVANFNFSAGTGSTKGLLGVEDAIRQLSELVPVPGSQTTAILYITRFIEDPSAAVAPTSAQNTAAEARKNHTSIYIFQTDFNQSRKDALQILADGSDGQYAPLDRTNFLSAASIVYQSIDAQRAYYSVSYRSPVAEGGQREITIDTPGRPNLGVTGSYEITLQPPAVSILEPVGNSTIRREASLGEEDEVPTFDVSQLRVSAEISWPDGFPRSVSSAQLFVNGNLETSISPAGDQSRFDFDWDLSDINQAGLNPVSLEVRVEDELGLSASSASNVTVEVILPPDPAGSGLRVTPTLAGVSVFVLCIMGAAVLGTVGAIVVYTRKRSAQVARSAAPAKAEVMHTLIAAVAPELVLATLTVQEGPTGLINEVFRINSIRTVLGRDPTKAEITFYADEESSVSRMHCTILLDDDNQFRLIDNQSTSGTRLNGRRIHPDVPVVLADGDEIVLGNLAQRGVKLRFSLATEDDISPYSGSADDRTHFIGHQSPEDWAAGLGDGSSRDS
jgi:hypothetical protein